MGDLVTVCNRCARARQGQENYGDACSKPGCTGHYNQHEDSAVLLSRGWSETAPAEVELNELNQVIDQVV